MIRLLMLPFTLPFKVAWIALIFAAVILAMAGCTTVHNDQRSCTTDCNIGSSQPVYTPAPVVVSPSVTYHPYRRYRRSPVVIYHW